MLEGQSMDADSDKDTPRRSRAMDAYLRLEEMIITMQLEPGAVLSETELARKLDLGRTPIREALQRLAAEHLVDVMPHRGIRVSPIDVKKQMRLLEVRRELERLVASRAARRASEDQRGALRGLARAFETKGAADYHAFLTIDRDFNTALSEASDNAFAVAALQSLHGLSRRFWHYYKRHEEDLETVTAMHARIARAVANKDEAEAAAAVEAHMDYIQAFTLALLQD